MFLFPYDYGPVSAGCLSRTDPAGEKKEVFSLLFTVFSISHANVNNLQRWHQAATQASTNVVLIILIS